MIAIEQTTEVRGGKIDKSLQRGCSWEKPNRRANKHKQFRLFRGSLTCSDRQQHTQARRKPDWEEVVRKRSRVQDSKKLPLYLVSFRFCRCAFWNPKLPFAFVFLSRPSRLSFLWFFVPRSLVFPLFAPTFRLLFDFGDVFWIRVNKNSKNKLQTLDALLIYFVKSFCHQIWSSMAWNIGTFIRKTLSYQFQASRFTLHGFPQYQRFVNLTCDYCDFDVVVQSFNCSGFINSTINPMQFGCAGMSYELLRLLQMMMNFLRGVFCIM